MQDRRTLRIATSPSLMADSTLKPTSSLWSKDKRQTCSLQGKISYLANSIQKAQEARFLSQRTLDYTMDKCADRLVQIIWARSMVSLTMATTSTILIQNLRDKLFSLFQNPKVRELLIVDIHSCLHTSPQITFNNSTTVRKLNDRVEAQLQRKARKFLVKASLLITPQTSPWSWS